MVVSMEKVAISGISRDIDGEENDKRRGET